MAKHHEDPENPDKIHFKDLKTRIESGGYPIRENPEKITLKDLKTRIESEGYSIRENHKNTNSSDKDCDSE